MAPLATPRDRLAVAALGAVIGLVALAVVRIAGFGWATVAADDARYLNVGLSVLDGAGAVTPDGDPYLLRSPVYGTLLAAFAGSTGLDPVTGGHLLATAVALAGLVGAVALAWRLAGAGGALACAVALVAMPLPWELIATLRIDLVATAGLVAMLHLLLAPTVGRWALAGAVFGLAMLVKEAALLAGLAPLAWLRSLPGPRWLAAATAFGIAAVVVAGWWWAVVWIETGTIFPLNALAVIEARDASRLAGGRALATLLVTATLTILAAGAWVAVLVGARRSAGLRALVLAGLGALVPALFALRSDLAGRNHAPLAVLSAVAIGVAVARLAPALRHARRGPLTTAAGALVLTAALVTGQVVAGVPSPGDVAELVASDLAARIGDGDRVVMPFRGRELVALRLHGRADIASLPVARVSADEPGSDWTWLGLRDRQLFGVRRTAWRAQVGRDGTRWLVLVVPHPLTPAALIPGLEGAPGQPGITPVGTVRLGGAAGHVFAVDPAVVATTDAPVLHADAAAILSWLDLRATAGVASDAAARELVPAVTSGSASDTAVLLERLRGRLCAGPSGPEGAIPLSAPGPDGTCPAG